MAGVWDLLRLQSFEEAESAVGKDRPSCVTLRRFLDYAADFGILDRLVFDLSVIRGLAYYTGIVFEAFDAQRELRAIFGGGRYDNLLSEIGGQPLTGVGLGFGDVVIAELMGNSGKSPAPPCTGDVIIGYMANEQESTVVSIAAGLRRDGKNVNLAFHPEKPKTFFSRAGAGAFAEGIYVGPDDVSNGTVRVKNLATREEREVRIEEITG